MFVNLTYHVQTFGVTYTRIDPVPFPCTPPPLFCCPARSPHLTPHTSHQRVYGCVVVLKMGNIIDRWTGKAELRERLEIEKALKEGSFYSSVSTVWESQEILFSRADLDVVRRQTPHPFYQKTIAAADKPEDELWPACQSTRSEFDPGSGSSLADNEEDSKTEKSRKRKLKEVTIDGSRRTVAEVAHLIPLAHKCAQFYAPLVEAAVGVNVEDDARLSPSHKIRKRQVLVHGQYTAETREDEGTSSRPVRMRDTGIKHCRTNMARVVAQAHFLDFKPSLLIIPVLTLDTVLTYNKGAYRVLIACATPEIYVESLLFGEYELCTKEDVETATATLTHFIKAAAYTLVVADDKELESKLKNPQRRSILQTKATLKEKQRVKGPVMLPWNGVTMKLGKLTLDMKEPNAHQECDPFLLFVKAAVVWSALQDQRLLPGCPGPHDCEECLERGLLECDCDAYDPFVPIPHEISVVKNGGEVS